MTRRLVRLALALVCLGATLVLSGCIEIQSEGFSQQNTIGDVTLTTHMCLSVPDTPTPPPGSCLAKDTNSGSSLSGLAADAQLLLAYRLPNAVGAPDQLTAHGPNLVNGPTVILVRSTSYEQQLQSLAPAPAGSRWVGYLSGLIAPTAIQPGLVVTASAHLTLGRSANGAPFPSPLVYRTVVGGRAANDAPNAPQSQASTRPVDCHGSLTTFNQPDATICVDSPIGPTAVNSSDTLAVSDLGVLNGRAVSAPAGSTATIPFQIRSSNLNGSPLFDLAAATTVPGATATPADATFAPQPDEGTEPVSVAIPANTPPGAYAVSLTAALGSAQQRTGTTTINVTAAPVPAAPQEPAAQTPPAAADKTPPTIALKIARQKLGAVLKKGLKVGVTCSEACNISVSLGSLGGGQGSLADAGTATVVAKLTARRAKALRHRASVTLPVQVTASDPAGNAGTASARVKLKR